MINGPNVPPTPRPPPPPPQGEDCVLLKPKLQTQSRHINDYIGETRCGLLTLTDFPLPPCNPSLFGIDDTGMTVFVRLSWPFPNPDRQIVFRNRLRADTGQWKYGPLVLESQFSSGTFCKVFQQERGRFEGTARCPIHPHLRLARFNLIFPAHRSSSCPSGMCGGSPEGDRCSI